MHCALINVADAALADIACEETHTGVSPAGNPLSSMPEVAALVRIVKNLTGKSFISFSTHRLSAAKSDFRSSVGKQNVPHRIVGLNSLLSPFLLLLLVLFTMRIHLWFCFNKCFHVSCPLFHTKYLSVCVLSCCCWFCSL